VIRSVDQDFLGLLRSPPGRGRLDPSLNWTECSAIMVPCSEVNISSIPLLPIQLRPIAAHGSYLERIIEGGRNPLALHRRRQSLSAWPPLCGGLETWVYRRRWSCSPEMRASASLVSAVASVQLTARIWRLPATPRLTTTND